MRLRPWVSLATLQEAENRDYVGRSCDSFLQNDFEQGAPIYERPGSLFGKVTEVEASLEQVVRNFTRKKIWKSQGEHRTSVDGFQVLKRREH